MKTIIGQQGEVLIIRLDAMPATAITKPASDRDRMGRAIISHSESGHHHVLTGGDVMERTNDVPAGMQVFYTILDAPERFIQDSTAPHDAFDLPPGVYEFRTSREFDPFAEAARRVAD